MLRWARFALLPAFWIGLVSGWVEVMIIAWRRLVRGNLVFVASDFWWLAPLITGLLIALATAFFTSVFPRRWSHLRTRVRYAVPVTLACLGIILLFSVISEKAALVLALGLGVQGSALLVANVTAFESIVRRTTAPLLLIPVLAGIGLHAAPGQRAAGLPRLEPRSDAPNILLIVLDTVRAIELGLYGFTPSSSANLDGFASQGVVFDQAFSTAPWTAPSHASLFTGRAASELSIDWKRPLDRRFPTLAEELRRAGYSTVGVVGNTLYTSAETGLARGFDWYEDSHLTWDRILLLPRLSHEAVKVWRSLTGLPPRVELSRVPASSINRHFMEWTRHRPRRPFFAFLNYYDAHAPYLAPEPYWSRFLSEQKRVAILVGPTPSRETLIQGRKAYDAALAYLDAELGRLFDAMLRRGSLDNTLVIITADHGEEFLEHGFTGHGSSLYTQSVRVPLIVVWPGHVPERIRVTEPVSLDRLPATILDLIGRAGAFLGPSLASYWNGKAVTPVAIRSSVSIPPQSLAAGPVVSGLLESVLVGPYRYIHHRGDSVGQLFDHRSDPLEARNLAQENGAGIIVRRLRDSLAAPGASGGAP